MNRSYYASSDSFGLLLEDIFGFNPFEVATPNYKTAVYQTRNSLPECFVSSDNPRNNMFLYDNGTMKIEVNLEGLEKKDIRTWFNKRENRFYIGLKEAEKAEKKEEAKDETKADEKTEEPKCIQIKRGFTEAKDALKKAPLYFYIDPERFSAVPKSVTMLNGKLIVEFGPADKSADENEITIS